MKRFAVVLAALLFVGGCVDSISVRCHAALAEMDDARDTLAVTQAQPRCLSHLQHTDPKARP